MSTQPPRYFHHLNYTLGNEDTSVEHAILPEGAQHVLCVAGSGSRVLPLIARHPGRVTCVDVSREQLQLTALRVEAARSLELGDYLAFWGFPPSPATPPLRRELYDRIGLAGEAGDHWRRVFTDRGWESLLYDGRWERTFAKLSRVNRALTRSAGRRLFSATTEAEHRRILAEEFPRWRWLLTLLLLGNPVVFNVMLYKGGFPRKNIPGTPFSFYRESFDRLFTQGPARLNFFLQVVFFGELLYPEGNPIECRPAVYAGIRSGLASCRVEYRLGDLFAAPHPDDPAVDFASCSDVASYLAPPREQTFLQDLRPRLAPGALVVVRTYLRVPERADDTGYEDVTAKYAREIAAEKVGVYQIRVLRRH